MGEEERAPYTPPSSDQGRDPYEVLKDHQEAARRYRERIRELEEQLRLAEAQYHAAMLVNEQRRDQNVNLRRLLVAVLPPDALYQEARQLARALRAQGARTTAPPSPDPDEQEWREDHPLPPRP